jgi:hypothetical protein
VDNPGLAAGGAARFGGGDPRVLGIGRSIVRRRKTHGIKVYSVETFVVPVIIGWRCESTFPQSPPMSVPTIARSASGGVPRVIAIAQPSYGRSLGSVNLMGSGRAEFCGSRSTGNNTQSNGTLSTHREERHTAAMRGNGFRPLSGRQREAYAKSIVASGGAASISDGGVRGSNRVRQSFNRSYRQWRRRTRRTLALTPYS